METEPGAEPDARAVVGRPAPDHRSGSGDALDPHLPRPRRWLLVISAALLAAWMGFLLVMAFGP